MNIHDLREAQVRFENRMDRVVEGRENLHALRSQFVSYFNRKKLQTMSIDEYVLGVDVPEGTLNFCYGIERQLDGLGRIIGATAFKFGIYFGRIQSDPNYEYRFTKKFGNTVTQAFNNVRGSILSLIDAGQKENIEAIAGSPISPMFKGKILSTYFPNRYLNVFADEHLNYFLIQLGLDIDKLTRRDAIYKREALITFKNNDVVMQHWSVDAFAHFLYTEYPGRPPKAGETSTTKDPLADYRNPDFPENQSAEFIELGIVPPIAAPTLTRKKGTSTTGKKDYEKEARKLRKLGDRGEKLVLELEGNRLKTAGRADLARKVERVSLKSDSYGYDILSFETDGTKRYIEVKATSSTLGNANFYFTANELETAQEHENYFIYIVYDVTSKTPKVWPIKNPFNPENRNVVKVPVSYKVTINTNLFS